MQKSPYPGFGHAAAAVHPGDPQPSGESPVSHSPPIENTQPRRKRPRQETSSRADVAYSRKRASAACRLCRSRKVKCNNTRPSCGNCRAHNAVCVYEDTEDISAFDPASIAILDKLTQVLSRLDHLPLELGQHGPIPDTPSVAPNGLESELEPQHGNDLGPRHQTTPMIDLTIPAAQTSPEAVLQWPILASASQFPSSYIIDAVFEAEMLETDSDDEDSPSYSKSSTAVFNEDEVLDLVQRFLDLVHIKNPVLEPETIWSYARRVAVDGLKWDGPSCLVLLACALGSVAREFPGGSGATEHSGTSLQAHSGNLQRGEGYYNLARRRLGLVQRGLLAPQCHFLAGVYLMYTMRPLPAWGNFHSASRSYHIYLQCQTRRLSVASSLAGAESSRRRRLEQRLYWSCYKSECELRTEMDLPNSSLAGFHYPDMHPSPPDMDAPSPEVTDHLHQPSGGGQSVARSRHPSSLNQHQEESWYYYLTEITLRRLANEIFNAFYANGHTGWNQDTISFMAKAAGGFEQQLEEWYATLPPPIRFNEDEVPERELTYMVRGRFLEIRCWLYRPFLFYAIHNAPGAPYLDMIQPLVKKAIHQHISFAETEPILHRHHGTWYHLRDITTNTLCMIAAYRCGTLDFLLPPEPEWKATVARTIERIRFWEGEAPGLTRAIEILQSLT